MFDFLAPIWDPFLNIIFQFLLRIENVVGNWGLAIIVLTVLVRLLLMPLTIKQTRSMYEMQRIQPKLKALQAKYKDDKEKLNEETLKFYQENKVNPFGGCLPMLLQMPLLIALYQVLGGTEGNPGLMMEYLKKTGEIGSFYFIIPDIAKTPEMVFTTQGFVAAIPYLLLVVLFGLSVWLPQALMPGDKQQKMIGLYMAAIMLFFGWKAPAGVLLYWDISSVWGVAQQQLMMRSLKRSHEDEEIVVEEPAVTKKSQKKSKKSS